MHVSTLVRCGLLFLGIGTSPQAHAAQALAGATGKYLVQLTEYEEDAFQLADNPERVVRQLRELQGNKGPPSGASPKKNANFELPNGEILEIEGLSAEDESLLSSGEEVVLPAEATMSGQSINPEAAATITTSGQNINLNGKPLGRPVIADNHLDRRLCSSNDQCDDNNACTTNVCDVACNFPPIANCCGNGICEPGGGEDFNSCFDDCAVGPFHLSTTLCSSCYIQDGNMFEVKAKDKALAITTLATRTYGLNGASGTFGVEVWTKQGTMVGFETSMASWTKIADVEFTSGPFAMLQFPDFASPVQIAAAATQSFYVTHKNGGKAFFSKVNSNTLAGFDDSLQIFPGYSRSYPFGGVSAAREWAWNGILTYMKDEGVVATVAPSSFNTKLPTPDTYSPTTSESPSSAPFNTNQPTPYIYSPTANPSEAPSSPPTYSPTTSEFPSSASFNTNRPTPDTYSPTANPSEAPSSAPTYSPTTSEGPSPAPSYTNLPTPGPSHSPTNPPTTGPSHSSTASPASAQLVATSTLIMTFDVNGTEVETMSSGDRSALSAVLEDAVLNFLGEIEGKVSVFANAISMWGTSLKTRRKLENANNDVVLNVTFVAQCEEECEALTAQTTLAETAANITSDVTTEEGLQSIATFIQSSLEQSPIDGVSSTLTITSAESTPIEVTTVYSTTAIDSWALEIMSFNSNFSKDSGNEITLNYKIGKGRAFKVSVLKKECMEAIDTANVISAASFTSPNKDDPSLDNLGVFLDIEKKTIVGSNIWDPTNQVVEFCLRVELLSSISGKVIKKLERNFGIELLFNNAFETINDAQFGQISLESDQSDAQVDDYIAACTCDSKESFGCNQNVLGPNDFLNICIKSIDTEMEINYLDSLKMTQGDLTLSIVQEKNLVDNSISSKSKVPLENGVHVATVIPTSFFNYESSSTAKVSGVVFLKLSGSRRRLAVEIDRALQSQSVGDIGDQESAFSMEVQLEKYELEVDADSNAAVMTGVIGGSVAAVVTAAAFLW